MSILSKVLVWFGFDWLIEWLVDYFWWCCVYLEEIHSVDGKITWHFRFDRFSDIRFGDAKAGEEFIVFEDFHVPRNEVTWILMINKTSWELNRLELSYCSQSSRISIDFNYLMFSEWERAGRRQTCPARAPRPSPIRQRRNLFINHVDSLSILLDGAEWRSMLAHRLTLPDKPAITQPNLSIYLIKCKALYLFIYTVGYVYFCMKCILYR